MLHECGNEQTPNAAVAVQEWVNGFKLDVDQSDAHQGGQGVVCVCLMNEAFQICQQRWDMFWWRRHKHGVAGARAANPVLRLAQFTGLAACAASTVHEQAVCLPHQAHAHGQPVGVAQGVLCPAKGAQVIGDFFHIVGVADGQPRFFVKQVDQRRLGAFNLGGEQGFFANGAVEQPVNGRHQPGNPLKTRQRQFGRAVELGIAGGVEHGRRRRQGMWHERPHTLPKGGGCDV